jgi:hypothetical protein
MLCLGGRRFAQPKKSGMQYYRIPLLLSSPKASGSKDLLCFVVAARSFWGGTAAHFGELNRSPAWAHGMVENMLKNLGKEVKNFYPIGYFP